MAETTEQLLLAARGWVVAVILIALMLPLLAFMYLDNLTTAARAEKALEKLEKLERQIERKNRDKSPDMFNDNPIFDRVRRPFSVPVPRPKKLG